MGIKNYELREFCIFADKLRIYERIFLDDNSFWSHFKNMQRINELQEETEKYNADYRRDQARIRELDRNPKAMEKIARERYFMKADDEDIFVLSDDGELENPIQKHEATE